MIEISGGKLYGKSVYGVPDGTYYGLEEYCVIYNLTQEQVRKWRERGQIRAVTVFGRSYIPSTEPPYDAKKGRKRLKKT